MRAADRYAAQNRRARHDYLIEDTLEAGLVLQGSEVKVRSCVPGRRASPRPTQTRRRASFFHRQRQHPRIQGRQPLRPRAPRRPRKAPPAQEGDEQAARCDPPRGRDDRAVVDLFQRARARQGPNSGSAKGKRMADKKRQADKDRSWQRDKARIMRARGLRRAVISPRTPRRTSSSSACPCWC